MVDNNEPFVQVSHPRFFRPPCVGLDVDFERGPILLRRSVAKSLENAALLLPKNVGFVLMLGYRSSKDQAKVFQREVENMLRSTGACMSRITAEREVLRYFADPRKFVPHATGGAIDLALVNITHNRVSLCDTGNNLFKHDERAHSHYENITSRQKENRELLASVMHSAEFTSFPFVFWHFSLGDKLDAYAKNTIARFDEVTFT